MPIRSGGRSRSFIVAPKASSLGITIDSGATYGMKDTHNNQKLKGQLERHKFGRRVCGPILGSTDVGAHLSGLRQRAAFHGFGGAMPRMATYSILKNTRVFDGFL